MHYLRIKHVSVMDKLCHFTPCASHFGPFIFVSYCNSTDMTTNISVLNVRKHPITINIYVTVA